MAESLDGLNNRQSQLLYVGKPDFSIIEILTQIIYGMFSPYIILLDQYHCHNRNGSSEIQEIVTLVIKGYKRDSQTSTSFSLATNAFLV